MRAAVQSYPRITGLAGGISLVIGGLLWRLGAMNVQTAIFFHNSIPSTISGIFILVGASILAIGIANETGIVGGSTVGKFALILFGARNLVLVLAGPFLYSLSGQSFAIFVGGA